MMMSHELLWLMDMIGGARRRGGEGAGEVSVRRGGEGEGWIWVTLGPQNTLTDSTISLHDIKC